MSEYFTVSGTEIKDKAVSADEKWDPIDLTSSDNLTVFIDSSVSCKLVIEVPDPDGDYHLASTYDHDADGDATILAGRYTNIRFSVDTNTTLTAWYEES